MSDANLPAATDSDPQAMFFKSNQVSAHWDTWMYNHAGIFYLDYLITGHSGGEGFGVATSPDGVTWTDHGWALAASGEMEIYLGTGSVWQAVDFETSGRFICNYSEHRREDDEEPQQRIYFAWSEDLIHWTKYGDEDDFRVDTVHYEKPGRWDCIYAIPKDGGGYYGYWTANPIGRVGFGYGQSDDGLHWQALPVPALDWDDGHEPESMEASAVEEVQGSYYALTGQLGLSVRTMIAEAPSGPFRVASRNYRLLENSGAHKHTYFARFFRAGGELLVNHHAITRMQNEHGRPVCYFSPLKKAVVDADGTLWLKYWPGNERLKRVELALHSSTLGLGGTWLSQTPLPTDDGIVLEGRVSITSTTGDKDEDAGAPGVDQTTGDHGSTCTPEP